jgi:hypothetical protein
MHMKIEAARQIAVGRFVAHSRPPPRLPFCSIRLPLTPGKPSLGL